MGDNYDPNYLWPALPDRYGGETLKLGSSRKTKEHLYLSSYHLVGLELKNLEIHPYVFWEVLRLYVSWWNRPAETGISASEFHCPMTSLSTPTPTIFSHHRTKLVHKLTWGLGPTTRHMIFTYRFLSFPSPGLTGMCNNRYTPPHPIHVVLWTFMWCCEWNPGLDAC